MTARFWRRATVVLAWGCIGSVALWWLALGWQPSVETMREAKPYGYAVSALTLLVWLANDRYSAAARAGR